jgi:hypothetical protein
VSVTPRVRTIPRLVTRRRRRRGLPVAVALVALVALVMTLVAPPAIAGSASVPDPGRHSFTGTINGAAYRVETPEHWNGTLILYSHGYFPPGFAGPGVLLTNSPEADQWLVDHGFALAASNFRGVTGFQVDQGYRDQLALLDWFDAHIRRPERTIATGQSMGVAIADQLAERNPGRFAGVVDMCSAHDPQNTFNAGLDMGFAVRTLILGDESLELVHLPDEQTARQASDRLVDAIDAAMVTREGRARLALAASLNNVTGWWSALQPRPTRLADQIRQQALWLRNGYLGVTGSSGPFARFDLEAKIGGNPSSNIGIDYRHQVAHAAQQPLVRDAYRTAGLNLDADLARLNAAPRIAADPAARAFMDRTSLPQGRISAPVVTLHTVGDGGAVPDQERWYAEQVRRHGRGDLIRQLYVERGQHCSISAADELVALQTLLTRIDHRRWPTTDPRRLNAQVSEFDPRYQVVTDLSTFDPQTGPQRGFMPPAFTRFTPPRPQRPSL